MVLQLPQLFPQQQCEVLKFMFGIMGAIQVLKKPYTKSKSRRGHIFISISASLFAFFVVAGVSTAWGQSLPDNDNLTSQLLPKVQSSSMVYAPVRLDGNILFTVAAEVSTGMGMTPGSMTPVESRAKAIEKDLYKIIYRGFEASTLKVTAKTESKQAAILLSDGKQYNDLPLLVLTEMDARIGGFTLPESAGYVAQVIQRALIRAQQERQSAYLSQQGQISAGIFLAMVCISLGLRFLQKRLMVGWRSLKEKQRQQEEQLATMAAAIDTDDEDFNNQQSQCSSMMSQQMSYERTLNNYDLRRHLLQLGHMVLWLGGIAWIVGLFPYTRWLQVYILQQPIVLGVILSTTLAIKYSGILIDRFLNKWANRESLTPQAIQRWMLRTSSFSPILKGIIGVHLAGLALLFVLASFNIPLAPVLAGAGILGFAISLGSQTLVKDLISGALILIEDQYAIGDFAILNDKFGRVERMNLRITTLRNRQGNVLIIPNSEIRIVNNLSKDWARVKLLIYIDYDTDIDYAISIIQQVADELVADSFWGPQIVEAEIRGVEEVDAGGFTIGLRFETQPGVYRKIVREYRRRMKPAFDRAGIKLGTNLSSVVNKFETDPKEQS
jgi:moderate conductance mechanosensitive channel